MLKTLTSSASRLVLLGVSFTLCAGALFEIAMGTLVITEQTFKELVGAVFIYYFTVKGTVGMSADTQIAGGLK